MEERIEICCCFTGHRPEKLGMSENDAKALLKAALDKAISDGYRFFISGMARGIDMWAADLVLQAREQNPDIHLICIIPYNGFEKSWGNSEKSAYNRIIEQADSVEFVLSHYSKSSFQLRNIKMVDRKAVNGDATIIPRHMRIHSESSSTNIIENPVIISEIKISHANVLAKVFIFLPVFENNLSMKFSIIITPFHPYSAP